MPFKEFYVFEVQHVRFGLLVDYQQQLTMLYWTLLFYSHAPDTSSRRVGFDLLDVFFMAQMLMTDCAPEQLIITYYQFQFERKHNTECVLCNCNVIIHSIFKRFRINDKVAKLTFECDVLSIIFPRSEGVFHNAWQYESTTAREKSYARLNVAHITSCTIIFRTSPFHVNMSAIQAEIPEMAALMTIELPDAVTSQQIGSCCCCCFAIEISADEYRSANVIFIPPKRRDIVIINQSIIAAITASGRPRSTYYWKIIIGRHHLFSPLLEGQYYVLKNLTYICT